MSSVSATSHDEKQRLWEAVHSITQPTHQKVDRGAVEWLEDGRGSFCRVADYQAATLAYGEIPCLWNEANWAVHGSEAGDGSGGKAAARERTPADLDLMETLLTIRESLGWQLPGRGIRWRKPGDIPDMMRQFAGHIVSAEPQHVAWWTFRFEQWARLLRTHLNALDAGTKPRYLRGAACPLCKVRQVTIERDDRNVVVPALMVDFVGKWIRAAQCQACGTAWFRGQQLNELADMIELSDTEGMISA